MDMPSFIAGMPKAELHIHIEGVLEPEMKFDMARRNGLVLPYDTVEDVIAAYDFDDLSTFLAARYEGDRVLVTEQDFYDLTMAYFEKGREENLIYAEIFFDPQAHTSRGVEFSTAIEGIKRACDDAVTTLGIDSQLLGNPEIGQYGCTVSVKKDVGWFEVAVDNAFLMHEIQAASNRLHQIKYLIFTHSFFYPLFQITTLKKFH